MQAYAGTAVAWHADAYIATCKCFLDLFHKDLTDTFALPHRNLLKPSTSISDFERPKTETRQDGDDVVNVHVQPDHTATYCYYSGYFRSVCWHERAADSDGVWLQAHHSST